MGIPFSSVTGSLGQPQGPYSYDSLNVSFAIAFDAFKAHLLSQVGAGSLFTSTPVYNLATGELSSAELSTSSINALKTQSLGLASSERGAFWNSVAEYILNVKDKVSLTLAETNALDAAIIESGINQTWESISNTVITQYTLIEPIIGTELSDYIAGYQGNDNLYGYGGNDILNGGTGNDTLDGGTGDDTYVFNIGDGQDIINETRYSGAGNDTILMGANITASNIRFEKSSYNLNIYYGTSDKITINYQFYDDSYGSNGYDEIETLKFADGSTINLKSSLTFTGTADVDNMHGTSIGDQLNGLSGNDNLYGYAGNDILNGGAGNDTLDGGTGDDTATYVNDTAAVTVNLSLTSQQNTIGSGLDTLSGIENLTGSAYNDTLVGDSNSNVIEGGAGNDTLDGAAGIDTVSYALSASAVTVNLATATAQNTGGAGTDTLTGFENILGSIYNDGLWGDAGANILDGGSGNDILEGGLGNDSIIGNAGIDTASYAGATAGVTVTLASTSAQNTVSAGTDTLAGIENLTGSAYNDTLTGDAGANVIDGGAGNDNIQGGLGNDILSGSAGTDTVNYSAATSATVVNLNLTTAQNTLSSGSDTLSGFENINGSAYDDILTGDGGSNNIAGNNGNDIIEGGLGSDLLSGGAGTDTLTYANSTAAVTVSLAITGSQNTVGAGNDSVSGFENLIGSGYNDILTGDSLANTIIGGAGNDLINGGLGADIFTGGLGGDIFKFSVTGLDTNFDRVTDFSTSQGDKIDFKDILVGYDPVTKAITDFIEFTTVGANTVVKVDRDGAGTTYGWQQVAQLDNLNGLTDEAALKASGNLIVA